jgi:pimeloyl-ACP methyl ester carboxylesterase
LEHSTVIDDPRGRIDYDETGEGPVQGPAMVLVPGSCSTGAAWRPMISHWKNAFRCVTTSLLGYGRTAERRTSGNADISLEAEMIEAVIERAGAPVHLVGHSFGGLSGLAVALRHPELLRSLTILEAPAPEILRLAGEDRHYDAFRTMTGAYFGAIQAGQSNAIAGMIDFYGGAGTFESWPQRVREYAIETTPVNVMDWASAYGFATSPSLLATMATPTLVVRGEKSHPAVKRANELLGRSIPGATVATVAGAAHFMIATHAGELADLIANHVGHAMA